MANGRRRNGGGQSSLNVEMYVTGTRSNLRVRVTCYQGAQGMDWDCPLRFGTVDDPGGFFIPDPDNTKNRFVINVKGGEGILDKLDLTSYPQFTKVAIIHPGTGRELVKDIPSTGLVSAPASLGTPATTVAAPAGPALAATKIKVVAAAERPHSTDKNIRIHTVQVFTTDETDKPAAGAFQRIVVGRCAPEDKNTADPTKLGFFSEEIEVSSGEKEMTYRAVLNNGQTAEVTLAGPPKPQKQGLLASLAEAFEEGRRRKS